MASATIKLFLPSGDARGFRTAEVSNWSGKALAAPRTELAQLLAREECKGAGVYVLTGRDPTSGGPHAYIGEAEEVGERLKQRRNKEFWVSAIVFTSTDGTLTKAHARHLESRLIGEAKQVARFTLDQNDAGGARLPESDREDMDVFLSRIRQLLPVLGSDLLTPILTESASADPARRLVCTTRGAAAHGERTREGFVVFKGSTAVPDIRPSAEERNSTPVKLRERLTADGTLVQQGDFLVFTRDTEFTSPSGAASVVVGGNANGLRMWKDGSGRALKDLDEAE